MNNEFQREVQRELADRFHSFERVSSTQHCPVFAATDTLLNRRVAIKVLRHRHADGDLTAPNELLVQARLSWHPNVLSLYDSFESASGMLYTILELAPGGSLESSIDDGRKIDREQFEKLGKEISSALAATHAAGAVHCDVKPSNILLADDGAGRLADFGISRWSEVTLDTLDNVRGSLRYVPPELLDGDPPTAANDVYALALTLHATAAGAHPFGARDQGQAAVIARIHTDRVSFRDLNLNLPPELFRLLEAALSKDPSQRPTSAELRDAFDSTRARTVGDSSHDPLAPAESTPARHRRRNVIAGLVVSVSLIAGVAIAATMLQSRESAGASASLRAKTASKYCATFQTSVAARIHLFETISADIEQSDTPSEVIRKLLVSYPAEFAQMMRPFLDASDALHGDKKLSVSGDDMAELALADAFRALAGGKQFLFDGQSGSYNPRFLPGELREPARRISQLYRDAGRRCPNVKVDLAAAKARMGSAILASMSDREFMSKFFEDPRSMDMVGPRVISIMFAMLRPYLSGLFETRWTWFVTMLDRRPDVRADVAFEHPDLIFEALAADPSLIPMVDTKAWQQDLTLGLARLDPTARLGLVTMYSAQLAAVHTEAPPP